ncbi:MAG TPA: hypothetical protein VKD91_18910 [Pyrinomonadaceae bacterium]|nr:hypothetical protein [Pyrinomonadaceae bacterium]
MITGYNTDVEFEGVVYHVQTEDKGLQTPIILSLVYSGGAILASKRSPYDDLVARGFDEDVLAERLQRQHRLICAAVHAGRIEELKQMAHRDSSPALASVDAAAQESAAGVAAETPTPQAEVSQAAPDRFAISEEEPDGAGLSVSVTEPEELEAGTSVTLKLNVRRHEKDGKKAVANAHVTIKTLGTAFEPRSTFATTDDRGAVSVLISLPSFTAGRGAVLIRAESDGEVAEFRKMIVPAKA